MHHQMDARLTLQIFLLSMMYLNPSSTAYASKTSFALAVDMSHRDLVLYLTYQTPHPDTPSAKECVQCDQRHEVRSSGTVNCLSNPRDFRIFSIVKNSLGLSRTLSFR